MARLLGPGLVLTILLVRAPWSFAALITFDFASTSDNRAGVALDGQSSGLVAEAGDGFIVTMHAAAGEPGSGDRFNHTGSPNFGINAGGSGDVTDAFDAGAGTSEFLEMFFTASVPASFELVALDFDRISGSGGTGEDAGLLRFADGASLSFDGQNVDDTDRLIVEIPLGWSEPLRLSHVDGNGFGLERLVLDVRPEPSTTVPEPASLVLLGLGAAMLVATRRPFRGLTKC